jgi:hypothetical protein
VLNDGMIMNMNWEGFGRKVVSCPKLRQYPRICLERLRRPTKDFSDSSECRRVSHSNVILSSLHKNVVFLFTEYY